MSLILITGDELLEIIKYALLLSLPIIYLTVGNFVGQEFIDCDMHFSQTMYVSEKLKSNLNIIIDFFIAMLKLFLDSS